MRSALDIAIVGGGTMGLAAAWALARRGQRVSLFERFDHVHEQGSHGGHTRIIRHAYHEGSDYVDLVSRADRLWTELGERAGATLLVRCGLLEFGPATHPEFAAAREALREHGIEHRILSPAEARARHPFAIPDDWEVCLSPGSGYLRVRPCLDALRREAEAAGALLRHRADVRGLIVSGEGAEDRPGLQLADGTTVFADRLVVAAGAGAGALLPSLASRRPLTVLRRVLAWTDTAHADLPCWAAFAPEGFFYGFPANNEGAAEGLEGAAEGLLGCKLACHIASDPALAWMNDPCDPQAVDRSIQPRDLAPLQDFIARYFPAAGRLTAAKTCLYTNTETGDFCVDLHPDDPRVVVAAGFSGHGFKFTPIIGELVADLCVAGRSELALPRFRISRDQGTRGRG